MYDSLSAASGRLPLGENNYELERIVVDSFGRKPGFIGRRYDRLKVCLERGLHRLPVASSQHPFRKRGTKYDRRFRGILKTFYPTFGDDCLCSRIMRGQIERKVAGEDSCNEHSKQGYILCRARDDVTWEQPRRGHCMPQPIAIGD